MHNNEEVLPHFILQLIHLFAVLPPETAFLSVYESGSTDSTGKVTPSSDRLVLIDAWALPLTVAAFKKRHPAAAHYAALPRVCSVRVSHGKLFMHLRRIAEALWSVQVLG